ncbi:MAG: amidohydrolase family protein [Sciscionella sp.]
MRVEEFDTTESLLLPEVALLPTGLAREQAVHISDGMFTHVGPATALLKQYPHLAPIRMDGHLMMPGFIDVHHHLTQSFGKALAFGEPSEIFRRLWVPLEQALDEESAYLAAKLAALESLRGGFTTVVDAGTRAPIDLAPLANATSEAGIRCVLGTVCNDLDENSPTTREIITRAEEHLRRFEHHRLVHPSLAVSIPEAASTDMLRRLSALAAESGTTFQFHVNEHLAAVEHSLRAHRRRPLEHLYDLGVLGPQVLAAHATLLTPSEVRILADTASAVAYNPVASAWKGNAVAPAALMAAFGVRFGLGTDGTRSDAFRLLDAAESAQRLTAGLDSGDSSCGAGWTWIDHATIDAAECIGLAGTLGAISVGHAADFLAIDITVPELQPSYDLTWELVRLTNRDQITAVVIDGHLRLWRGWPTDWDGPNLVAQAAKVGQEICARAPIQRTHPTAADHRTHHRRGPLPAHDTPATGKTQP